MALKPSKTGTQGGHQPYTREINLKDGVEKKFDHMLFNLDLELIEAINDYIAQEQRAGIKMWDENGQKDKKINKSLWAREVFRKALSEANYQPTPIPNRGE